MAGMFAAAAPSAAYNTMPQQDMITMFMQFMMQMMQGQMPQIMMQCLQQMMQSATPCQPLTTCTNETSQLQVEEETTSGDEQLLTVNQVAKLLQINKVTLWRMHKDGRLVHYKIGGTMVRYKKKDVDNYIKSNVNNHG